MEQGKGWGVQGWSWKGRGSRGGASRSEAHRVGNAGVGWAGMGLRRVEHTGVGLGKEWPHAGVELGRWLWV